MNDDDFPLPILLFWLCMLQMFASACEGRLVSMVCAAIGMVISKLVVDADR